MAKKIEYDYIFDYGDRYKVKKGYEWIKGFVLEPENSLVANIQKRNKDEGFEDSDKLIQAVSDDAKLVYSTDEIDVFIGTMHYSGDKKETTEIYLIWKF